MPHPNPQDWKSIDWHLPTAEIAKVVHRSENTVTKMRKIHAPETMGKYRLSVYRYTPEGKKRQLETSSKSGRMNQPRATAGAMKSKVAGKFESNIHASEWKIISPDGVIYQIRNLHHFVRENPDLFYPADVIWKRTSGKRGSGGEYCNATAGLGNVRAKKSKAWKGWTLDD